MSSIGSQVEQMLALLKVVEALMGTAELLTKNERKKARKVQKLLDYLTSEWEAIQMIDQ